MADKVTIARPYAKAIFDHAMNQNALSVWSTQLQLLTDLVMQEDSQKFLRNSTITAEQQVAFLTSLVENKVSESEILNNLISLLADNRRLMILPDIAMLYDTLRAEQEKTLEVSVRSFSKLSNEQEAKLKKVLSERLKRDVSLKIEIDESLIGGAVIKAGDLTIDGSVRGKLNTLRTRLAA